MVLICLSDGTLFQVNHSLREVSVGFQHGLERRQLIQIHNPQGQRWLLNPEQIIYIKGEDEPEPSLWQRFIKQPLLALAGELDDRSADEPKS